MIKYKVLFVCLGNICRSPSAEGVFREIVVNAGREDEFFIDSAGTGSWHAGSPPDNRARKAALGRGIDISGQRARQVLLDDFSNFDYILAMDEENLSSLLGAASEGARNKVHLFLDFAPDLGVREVPDPYYGGEHGFDHVLDLIEAASRGFLAHLDQT